MTDKKTYEDIVNECAETRRDLDTVLHPMFSGLKKAFQLVFSRHGYTKTDFKRLSDMVYYVGGYPSETSPAREVALADQVASVLKMEEMLDRSDFKDYLKERGIHIDVIECPGYTDSWTLDKDEQGEMKDALGSAGVDLLPSNNREALKVLIKRAQELQGEICETADTIKVEAAELVESEFKIRKSPFIKAVGFAAVKLRRGEGILAEKLDQYIDGLENAQEAIEPLMAKKQ